jgi:hypothetical protein
MNGGAPINWRYQSVTALGTIPPAERRRARKQQFILLYNVLRCIVNTIHASQLIRFESHSRCEPGVFLQPFELFLNSLPFHSPSKLNGVKNGFYHL